MSGNTYSMHAGGEPYATRKESLSDSTTDLTSFFFHRGANVNILTYTQGGIRKHTFIINITGTGLVTLVSIQSFNISQYP